MKQLLLQLIFITNYFLLIRCESEECFNCVELFHKESQVECAQGPSDCGGECLAGFAAEDNGPYITCYPIEITLNPPSKILADSFNSVSLPCEFSAKVRCGWTKDGTQVNIYRRDRFHVNIERETTNCTLVINSTKTIDSGVWQCMALSDSNTDWRFQSEETTLKVLDLSSEEIAVDSGYQVFLTCFSDEPTECQWWNKKYNFDMYEIVNMTDEIQYVDDRIGPKYDCSIRIRNMWSNEFLEHYYWSCWAQDKHKHLFHTSSRSIFRPAVYFNSMAIGNQTVPFRYYKALDNDGQFTCLNNTISITFILITISAGNFSMNSRGISLKEMENYNDNKWSRVLLTCPADDDDDDFSTTTVITNNKSVAEVSDDQNANDEKLLEATSAIPPNAKQSHFVRITFQNVSINGETKSYESLKFAENNQLRCTTDTTPTEMRWTIDKDVSARENDVQSLDLKFEAIEAYYLKQLPNIATVRCDTDFNNGTIISAYAKITFPTPELKVVPKFWNEVQYDKTIALECVFGAPVRCGWTRKNQFINDCEEIEISGNYEYLNDSPGPKTNCSIRIEHVGVKEEGKWICRGYYGQDQHVDSDEAIIIGKYGIVKDAPSTTTQISPKLDIDTVEKTTTLQHLTTVAPKVDKSIIPSKSASPPIINSAFLLISLTLLTLCKQMLTCLN